MLTITPFLWFETQAEEAMNYYASIFPRAKTIAVNRTGGAVMSVVFELEGQKFMALNGRPNSGFNDSVSFFVGCETQQEIDVLWERLTADGGATSQCGWLKDKFGLSWQIIPNSLGQLLSGGGDPRRSKRVVDAMLRMKKLNASKLQAAYDGA